MTRDELLGWVRYPDEPSVGFDDRITYDDMVESLKIQAGFPPGALRDDALETLAELDRRWTARQRSAEPARVSA